MNTLVAQLEKINEDYGAKEYVLNTEKGREKVGKALINAIRPMEIQSLIRTRVHEKSEEAWQLLIINHMRERYPQIDEKGQQMDEKDVDYNADWEEVHSTVLQSSIIVSAQRRERTYRFIKAKPTPYACFGALREKVTEDIKTYLTHE